MKLFSEPAYMKKKKNVHVYTYMYIPVMQNMIYLAPKSQFGIKDFSIKVWLTSFCVDLGLKTRSNFIFFPAVGMIS